MKEMGKQKKQRVKPIKTFDKKKQIFIKNVISSAVDQFMAQNKFFTMRFRKTAGKMMNHIAKR